MYNNCYEELPAKEFLMLLMPMLAQVVAYQSVINYYNLYDFIKQVANGNL